MKVTRAGVDRSSLYLPEELTGISIALAGWDGDVGQGSIPIPDPAGNQEPYEGEQLLLEEGATTIVDGFLGAIASERGGTAVGTRRVHTVTLADDNALLTGHATPGWSRPAESPAARWAAFVDDFLPGSINTTWLLTTNESGITLPKKVYRTDALFEDLSADTIGPTGKTVYIEHRRFHWHLPTEGQTCSLSIHDTVHNETTSFFPTTVARSKDGMDLRTKIYARNDKGVVVSVSDATAISRHEGAGLKHQGFSEYGSETAAEMTRDIGVTLAERKAERTTWTYAIGPLTGAQAAALIPGSQMTVTVAVHGLSAAVKRIARVTLTYRHGPDSRRYMALVELGYPRRLKRKPTKSTSGADSSGGAGVESGGCGGCLPFDASVPRHWWFGTFTFADSGGGGAGGSDGTGTTIFADINMPGPTFDLGVTYNCALGMIVNSCDYDYGIGLGDLGTGIHLAGFPHLLGGSTSFTGDGHAWAVIATVARGTTGPCASPPGPAGTVNVTFWVDPDGWDPPAPSSGQPVYNDRTTGDGTTTTFPTTFGYRPGTLHVKVNGIENTDDLTATDGTTVTFGHPPKLNADIVFDYEAS